VQYELERPFAAQAEQEARATFIRRTYAHLAGSVLVFMALEALLLQTVTPQAIFSIFGRSQFGVIAVFLAFWAASWIAQVWARSETSVALQYAGLGLYIVAEAVIFLPMLYYAQHFLKDEWLIPKAGILTAAVFGGLTMSVFVTRKDYSFLGPVLCVGGWIAMGVIFAALLIPGGFSLGLWFSFAMVALISGYILYETSAILLRMRTDQHVAAALMLFSSVATLFYYILRILMAFSDRN
jgi:FtsH-binding integral membrane protein